MRREYPGCPKLGYTPVDVRDVAIAHIAAMTNSEAVGKRFSKQHAIKVFDPNAIFN